MHMPTIRGQLLLFSVSSRYGYYSRAATIRGAASIRINMVYVCKYVCMFVCNRLAIKIFIGKLLAMGI